MSLIPATIRLFKGSIKESTRVTFPRGALQGLSKVQDIIVDLEGRIALLVCETPFHPLDTAWPDQPTDLGCIRLRDREFKIVNARIFAVNKATLEVKEGNAIPKKERDLWFFTVGHYVEREEPSFFLDQEVHLEVDGEHRQALSLHHTACHLAAFALNQATTGFWNKPDTVKRQDSLNSPDFDSLTMDTSRICRDHSCDFYRFGKSVRKEGLQVEKLMGSLIVIQERVNALLATWIATGARIEISCEGTSLNDTRKWRCHLSEKIAEVFCGGTHISALSHIQKIEYSLERVEQDGEMKLRAITKAYARSESC